MKIKRKHTKSKKAKGSMTKKNQLTKNDSITEQIELKKPTGI